jgi:succinate dehydrogenase/fumarate reductase flavoprotein subunit
MAGLVAAVRARELGAETIVYEKGNRPGGSMLLSSCVPWRHVEWDELRRECPDGDPTLQRVVWERFDDAIAWLERTTSVEPMWQDTNNPLTTGRRYDPRALTNALVRAAGEVRLSHALERDGDVRHQHSPVVLATGGFPVRLAREHGLLVRSNPWSDGDGFDYARHGGAAIAGDLGEFYGRVMPAPPARVGEDDYVRLSQLYGGLAVALDNDGSPIFEGPPAWHENDIAQAIARQPAGTAWYVLPKEALELDRFRAARDAGANVAVEDDHVRIRVATGVTHTLGGLRVDERARVLDEAGRPIDGLFAAGVDVGGIASGGYASGLAQALVLGLVAAESAVGLAD